MKVKMLRSLTPGRRGTVVDITDREGEQLIKRGLAVPADAKGKKKTSQPADKPDKKSGRNGGQNGKGKRSPSLPEDQASPDLLSGA